MSETEMEKQRCDNCKRDIPSTNFVMHTTHCLRHITLCPECKEPVKSTEIEAHRKEVHLPVSCVDCGVQVAKRDMDVHKAQHCSKRRMNCAYCEIDLEADELADHEDYCGSRTERCSCGQLVMMKYRETHIMNVHEQQKEGNLAAFAQRVKDTIETARNRSARAASSARIYPEPTSRVPGQYYNVLYNPPTRSSQHSGTWPPATNVVEHDEHLADYFERAMPPVTDNIVGTLRGQRQHQDTEEDVTMLPCEFCNRPIPANELILHQTGCRPDLSTYGQSSGQHEDRQPEAPFAIEQHNFVPCQFCGQLYIIDNLMAHQFSCPHNYINSESEEGSSDTNSGTNVRDRLRPRIVISRPAQPNGDDWEDSSDDDVRAVNTRRSSVRVEENNNVGDTSAGTNNNNNNAGDTSVRNGDNSSNAVSGNARRRRSARLIQRRNPSPPLPSDSDSDW